MNRWSQLPTRWHSMAAETPDSVLLQTSRFDPAKQAEFSLPQSGSDTVGIEARRNTGALSAELEEALASGLYVAGFVGYECGYHFQSLEDVSRRASSELPLAWFGVYRNH